MDVFYEIECLTEFSKPLKGLYLRKKWFKSADKRIIGQYLQKFIEYNKQAFRFLGVTPIIEGTDQNCSLRFKTTQFVGSIPLRSPDTGKQIGDFVVSPRYASKDRYLEYIKIMNLLDDSVNPEFMDSLPLVSGRNFRPPLYFEAVKFVRLLNKLTRTKWQKFDRIEKDISSPSGQINWKKYIEREFKVENRIRFPIGKSILSEYHIEYGQIRYVFNICKQELLSANTPYQIKLSSNYLLRSIEERIKDHKPLEIKEIKIRQSDSVLVKACKRQSNKILKSDLNISVSWRVDFSEVFERFTQHIFRLTAKELGASFLENYKIKSKSSNYNVWELGYVEPDGFVQKGNMIVYMDAKYKSHMYNKHSLSDSLKDEHRHDLHQIMGYTSFSTTLVKNGLLCYPASSVELDVRSYTNPINLTTTKIWLLGVPLDTNYIVDVKKELNKVLTQIEREVTVPNNV